MQKKTLTHLIGIPALLLLGALASAGCFLSINSHLQERARAVEQQLASAQSIIADLRRTNTDLEAQFKQSLETIRGLERTEGQLRQTVTVLGRRIADLEDSIQSFIAGFGEIETTNNELRAIILDSLRILRAIQERS